MGFVAIVSPFVVAILGYWFGMRSGLRKGLEQGFSAGVDTVLAEIKRKQKVKGEQE